MTPRPFRRMRMPRRMVAVLVVLLVGSMAQTGIAPAERADARRAGESAVIVARPAERCGSLAGTQVTAGQIALPTRGSRVTSAVLVEAAAGGSLSHHCEVKGSILAADPADPPINFQLNLPSKWNRGGFHFGGAGFNGTVVSGLDNVSHAPADSPTPLRRGYLTFGDDSGHQGQPFDGEFGANGQALANYAGESVKRSHDNAVAIAERYYGQAPSRMYFGGGSKGGHEGLVAAQRYGVDYDGVIAYYPANQNQAMVLSWFRMWEAAYRKDGGHLDAVDRQFLHDQVLQACDSLDGAADSVVSDVDGCHRVFSVRALLCENGETAGEQCLTAAQVETLNTAGTAMRFAFPLANGVSSIGPYPIFEGGDTGPWLTDPPTAGAATAYGFFTDQTIRFFIQQSAAATTEGFDYRDWRSRVRQISRLYDATNPDMDRFRAGGGKLLLVQGTTDMLVSHTTTSAYFETVRARYGTHTDDFVTYYVVPGFAHSDGAFPMTWDSLTALEQWQQHGRAPVRPVAVAAEVSRPMCDYPSWPRYRGTGDQDDAANFRCVAGRVGLERR